MVGTRYSHAQPQESQSFYDQLIEIFASPDDRLPFIDFPVREIANPAAARDAGFTKAKQWLKLCEDTHSCVRHPNIPPLLPARVIDVGESPIRLYEPTDGERGKYVCLSHCWGSTSSVCRTTPKTYEAHKENIVWAILPATFRDTINVTRRLGIRFLWIDSLCIIQEDDNDWREQSSLMAEVYGNAFLTIFATSSANGHGGLYPSIPLELRPQQNIVTDRNGIVFRVHIRKNLQDQHLTTPGEVEPSQNRPNWFPLQNRAWAFQELQAEFHKGQWMIEQPAPHDWKKVVETFSVLDLTYPRDKLPAISGIAKKALLYRPPGDTYLAGLWESTLLSDMSWTVQAAKREPHEWRAPSWSWASVDGHVHMGHDDVEEWIPKFTVVDVQVSLAGPDPTGEVSSGHVVIYGKAFRSQVMQLGIEGTFITIGPCGRAPITLDWGLILPTGKWVACLLLGTRDHMNNFFGMTLREVDGGESSANPTYERVGSTGLFFADMEEKHTFDEWYTGLRSWNIRIV
ncbi:hypothetical protein OQA88_13392 [Cercophora sp. LCS_1]